MGKMGWQQESFVEAKRSVRTELKNSVPIAEPLLKT
jgi:hypothetical protein